MQNSKDFAGHYAFRFSRNDSLARIGIFRTFKQSYDYIVRICDRSYTIALLVLISVDVITSIERMRGLSRYFRAGKVITFNHHCI